MPLSAHWLGAEACQCRELGGQTHVDDRPPDRLLWAVNTFGEARAFRAFPLLSATRWAGKARG